MEPRVSPTAHWDVIIYYVIKTLVNASTGAGKVITSGEVTVWNVTNVVLPALMRVTVIYAHLGLMEVSVKETAHKDVMMKFVIKKLVIV